MKKILFVLVFVFFTISIQAQSQNQQMELHPLVQKVDSLEHELSYLKLTYELYTLNLDITIFTNEVYTKSIAIKLDLYNRNFNSELGKLYQQYYDSCIHKKQSILELIEAKKKVFTIKVITYPYTERELSTLMAMYDVIDGTYSSLERSLNMLKITIDAYQKLM